MASLAPRQLKIGTIIDKTLGVIEHNTRTVLLYVLVLSAINAAITYFSVTELGPTQQMGVEVVKFAIGISAAYVLLEAMLSKTGLRARTAGDVFFPYLGLSIVYGLGVMVGFILVILPGLLIMARWIIAQPMLVARGGGIMASLGESWERTRGSEFQIIAAALALLVLLIAVIIAAGALFEQADPIGIVVAQLATSATSVVSLAMGVALYGLIAGGTGAEALPAR